MRSLRLVAALWITLSWVPGLATPDDPGEAWRRYLAEDLGRRPAMRFPWQHCFDEAAARYGLPVTLLLAVARGESDFDVRARSSADALGLMQIRWPITAKHLGFERASELYDACRNVDGGARYLDELLGRYAGDLHLALAAYNYGPARIPGDGRDLPEGAVWYSRYIYRHLGYVLGERVALPGGRYVGEHRLTLAEFRAGYRASAFAEALEALAPAARLEVFRAPGANYRVEMLYDGEAEYHRARQALRVAGFDPEAGR